MDIQISLKWWQVMFKVRIGQISNASGLKGRPLPFPYFALQPLFADLFRLSLGAL